MICYVGVFVRFLGGLQVELVYKISWVDCDVGVQMKSFKGMGNVVKLGLVGLLVMMGGLYVVINNVYGGDK